MSKQGFTIAELFRLKITKKLNNLADVIHSPSLSPIVSIDWKGENSDVL